MVRPIGRACVVIAWLLGTAGSAAADPQPITLHDALAAVRVRPLPP